MSDTSKGIVCVSDRGMGIDKKHHDKIFTRFYRVYEDDQKTYPGMGVGLYISSEIIKKHGGDIWFESKKGKGSRFYFSVPFSKNGGNKREKI